MKQCLSALAVLLLVNACTPEPGQGKILPGELVIAQAGVPVTLKAEILDTGGVVMEKVEIQWSSSDPSVVTVDPEGVLKAVGSGDAVVTAKAGTVNAKCDIKVKIIGQVETDPASLEMKPEETKDIMVKVTNDKGALLAGEKVTFASNNEDVATVDDNGKVTAVAVGEAKVFVKAGQVQSEVSVKVALEEEKKPKKKSRRKKRR